MISEKSVESCHNSGCHGFSVAKNNPLALFEADVNNPSAAGGGGGKLEDNA